jgi:hypothetical protein
MNHFKYTLLGLGIYVLCFMYFAINGAIIHNDTVAYIGFANEISNGVFPHSALYQPGVGFFIAFINFIFGLDYFDSFRMLNFLYGIGIILLLKSIFVSQINKLSRNLILLILLSSSPFIALFSNFLYADIGFVFYSLLSLFLFARYVKNEKLYLLLLSSFFVAFSIFTKYNGLSVLLTGIMFLLINGFKKKQYIKTLNETTMFAILPLAYIVFWKLYNGNLGGVEFNSYVREVNLECMIKYLKINVVSMYHLFLETFFFSTHAHINHYLLIMPFIILISFALISTQKQNKHYVNDIKQNKHILIYYLFSIIYLLSMIGIQSLNCITEISIRMFIAPIIIINSIIIHYAFFVFNISETQNRKVVSFVILLYILFFNIYYLIAYNKNHEQFKLSKNISKYSNIMEEIYNNKEIKTIYATPGFTREFFIFSKRAIQLKQIPYQSYYDYDKKVELNNFEYFNLIKEKSSELKSGQALVIEFKPIFIYSYKDSLNRLNIKSNDHSTYLFQNP